MAGRFTFIDLFSGAGGMSYGFHAHPAFEVLAAFDAERGKPSSPSGSLGCNATYRLNIGIEPTAVDLSAITEDEIQAVRDTLLGGADLDVLSACPPCTGFSRANPENHLRDDGRNSLVARTGLWVRILRPKLLVMENAREMLSGNFAEHFGHLKNTLEGLGYVVHSGVHMLNTFGLPQKRERALVVASRVEGPVRSLEELWEGFTLEPASVSVRAAIEGLPVLAAGDKDPRDAWHVSPKMGGPTTDRIAAIPADGGSWRDLVDHPRMDQLMTPAMKRRVAAKKFGDHPDVYGRMAWDKPCATIKRECSHVGNGRYAHPEQNRLCTVRELALLQGFPRRYKFGGKSLSNMYRHIGDAVPPLISHQLAHVAHWTLTGNKPRLRDCLLFGTPLEHAVIDPPEPPAVQIGLFGSGPAVANQP